MKKLQYGMVGGGPGSFIGDAHRKAINIDAMATLTAGCFSRSAEKCRQTGEELGIAADRCYVNYEEMAKAEAARADGIDFVVVVTPNVSHYPVCKAFLQAGLDATQFSAHKLRHTAATMMLSGGVDVKTVQEVLGHENLNTTQIYTHIENTELKIAAQANPLSKLDFSDID